MMRAIRRVCAWLLVALGGVHVLYTAVEHDALTPDAVWFAGAGLALVFLGMLNLAAPAADHRSARAVLRAADLLGVAYGLLAVIAVPVPQAFLGLGLMLVLAAAAFAPRRTGSGAAEDG
ncbi:MAG TPA: hypothetical protein VF746_22090 [Longimicrobium sp.]|jgi:hypothetical protein